MGKMGWRQVEEKAQGPKMLSTMTMDTESGVVSSDNDTSAHSKKDSRLFKREVSLMICHYSFQSYLLLYS